MDVAHVLTAWRFTDDWQQSSQPPTIVESPYPHLRLNGIEHLFQAFEAVPQRRTDEWLMVSDPVAKKVELDHVPLEDLTTVRAARQIRESVADRRPKRRGISAS